MNAPARISGRVRLYACIEGARYGLNPAEVMGDCRSRQNVAARRAVWLRLKQDGFSYAAIGRMTNRDHSTILHGLRAAK